MIDQYRLKLIFQSIEKIQAELVSMKSGPRDGRISLDMINHVDQVISKLKSALETGNLPPKPRQPPMIYFVLDSWPQDLSITLEMAKIDFLYDKL